MTDQKLFHGDVRDLSFILDKSVHLVFSSLPYFNLKEYRRGKNSLVLSMIIRSLSTNLRRSGKSAIEFLVLSGRVVCIVGDVCLSRKKFGRHVVMQLYSDIEVSWRKIGFDNLNPVLWYKISNASLEANINSSF